MATVIDPLTEPVPPSWDAFVAAERVLPLWSSRILLGADWCAQAPSSMVLVAEAGSAAPVALFHARHIGSPAPTRFTRPGRLPAAGVTICRIVPGLMDAGMAFAAGADARDRIEAVRAFERAVRRRGGLGALVIAYRELGAEHVAAVPTAWRVRLRQTPTMVLGNEWSDITAYLATLPRKWRAQLNKIHTMVGNDPDVRVDIADTIDPAQACWLAELVRRRYAPRAIARPPTAALYFEQLAELPEARFLTYRDPDGHLLAFTAFLDTGDDLLLINWGSRGEVQGRRTNLYVDQYRRLIELMITTGRRRMVMGKGMAELKARYGARPVPLWGVVGLW